MIPGLACGGLFWSPLRQSRDRHVVPEKNEKRHVLSRECWCGPNIKYENIQTGARIYIHRVTGETGN